MSVNINIPEELYDQARTIAEAHHVSVEQVFAPPLPTSLQPGSGFKNELLAETARNSWPFSIRSQTLSPRNTIAFEDTE
jgi:hypothetical protein